MFGTAGSSTDSTKAINSALSYLESHGGGVLYFPPGTYYVSLANADHQYSCVRIPANITFCGAGVGSTIIQRLPSERGVDGVLITNKGYDTASGYAAAGNITLRDFTITDGEAVPTRVYGDLIGIGHGKNITIERVEQGRHDQHFVDICGSTGVTVKNCHGTCDMATTSVTFNSDIQIDAAQTDAIFGINADGTPSTNVIINGNNFKNTSSNVQIEVGHATGVYRNIIISDNILDSSYVADSSVIGCASTFSTLINVNISNNQIITNHLSSRGLNFYSLGTNEKIVSISCNNNTVRGLARVGAWFGTNSNYTGTSFPHESASIIGNKFLITSPTSGTFVQGIVIAGWSSVTCNSNSIEIYSDNEFTSGCSALSVWKNRSAKINSNTLSRACGGVVNVSLSIISLLLINPEPASISSASNIHADGNTFHGDIPRYAINHLTGWTEGNDNIVVSGSVGRFNQTLIGTAGAHMYETYPISDRTNFKQPVLINGQYRRQVFNGNNYPSTFNLKKNGTVISGAKVEISATTGSSSLTGGELINTVYLSATTSAGVTANAIDLTAGTMNIITGTTGVSMNINSSTQQPEIRTSMYITASISI
jgi:hypothetical protein